MPMLHFVPPWPKNPCASFLNVVIAVSMVAVTVATGGATAASIVAGGAEAFQWLSKNEKAKKELGEVIADANQIKTRLEGYAKDAQGVADAAARAKDFLGGDEQKPPSDQVKVSMSREDFNRMIEPYKNMAQAQYLRALMEKFFSMTETRNSLLLEHTQLIVELTTIRSEIATAQRHRDELERLQGSALLARIGDVYEAALWADLEVGRRHLAALAEANSAFVYEWRRDRVVDLSSTRADHIENQYSAMLDDRRRIPEDNSLAAVCEFTLDPVSHREVFDQLRKDRAQLSLMPGHVDRVHSNRWDERAFSVGIRLVFPADYLPKQAIETTAMLTSMGLSWFKDENAQVVAMKVPRRGARFTARRTLDMDLVHEERNLMDARADIVEIAPYGVWSLHLPGISEHIKHLQKIHIVFAGTARYSAEMRVSLRRFGDVLLADKDTRVLAFDKKPEEAVESALPLALIARKNLSASPHGPRIREAMQLRMIEDAIYDPERAGEANAQS